MSAATAHPTRGYRRRAYPRKSLRAFVPNVLCVCVCVQTVFIFDAITGDNETLRSRKGNTPRVSPGRVRVTRALYVRPLRAGPRPRSIYIYILRGYRRSHVAVFRLRRRISIPYVPGWPIHQVSSLSRDSRRAVYARSRVTNRPAMTGRAGQRATVSPGTDSRVFEHTDRRRTISVRFVRRIYIKQTKYAKSFGRAGVSFPFFFGPAYCNRIDRRNTEFSKIVDSHRRRRRCNRSRYER